MWNSEKDLGHLVGLPLGRCTVCKCCFFLVILIFPNSTAHSTTKTVFTVGTVDTIGTVDTVDTSCTSITTYTANSR